MEIMQLSSGMDDQDGEMVVKRLSVPVGLEELMSGLTKEVLTKKPKDIYTFASEHFAQLLSVRDNGNYRRPTSKTFGLVNQDVDNLLLNGHLRKSRSSSGGAGRQLSRQVSIRAASPTRKSGPGRIRRSGTPKHDDNNNEGKTKVKQDKSKPTLDRRQTPGNKNKFDNLEPVQEDALKIMAKKESLNRRSTDRKSKDFISSSRDSKRSSSVESEKLKKKNSKQSTNDQAENFNKAESKSKKKKKNASDKFIPKNSSVEEGTTSLKDGRLTVTPPKIIKEAQKPTDQLDLPTTLVVPVLTAASTCLGKDSEKKEGESGEDLRKDLKNDSETGEILSLSKDDIQDKKYDPSLLREELKKVDEEAKLNNFTSSYNPYKLRQEIKNVSTEMNGENASLETKDALGEGSEDAKKQSPHLGVTSGLQHSGELHDMLISKDTSDSASAADQQILEDKEELNSKKLKKIVAIGLQHSGELHDSLIPTEREVSNEMVNGEELTQKPPVGLQHSSELHDTAISTDIETDNNIFEGEEQTEEKEESSQTDSNQNKSAQDVPVEKKESVAGSIFASAAAAATRIQSLWRGFNVRKTRKSKVDELVDQHKVQESELSPNLSDEDIMQAATKIQAGVRGYLTRKQQTNKSSAGHGVTTNKLSDEELHETLAQLDTLTVPTESPKGVRRKRETELEEELSDVATETEGKYLHGKEDDEDNATTDKLTRSKSAHDPGSGKLSIPAFSKSFSVTDSAISKTLDEDEEKLRSLTEDTESLGEQTEDLGIESEVSSALQMETGKEVEEGFSENTQVTENVLKDAKDSTTASENRLMHTGELHDTLVPEELNVTDNITANEQEKNNVSSRTIINDNISSKELPPLASTVGLQHSGELHDSLIPKELDMKDESFQDDKSKSALSHQQNEEHLIPEISNFNVHPSQNEIKLAESVLQHTGELHDVMIPKETENQEQLSEDNKNVTSEEAKPDQNLLSHVVSENKQDRQVDDIGLQHSSELHDIMIQNDAEKNKQLVKEGTPHDDKDITMTSLSSSNEQSETTSKDINKTVQDVHEDISMNRIALQHSSELHDFVVPKEIEEIGQDDKSVRSPQIKDDRGSSIVVEETDKTGELLQNDNKLPATVLEHSSELHDSVIPIEIEENLIAQEDNNIKAASPQSKGEVVGGEVLVVETNQTGERSQDNIKLPSTVLQHSSELHDSVIPKEIEENPIGQEDNNVKAASPQSKEEVVGSEVLGGETNQSGERLQEDIKLPSTLLEHSSEFHDSVITKEIDEEQIVQKDYKSIITANPQSKEEVVGSEVLEEESSQEDSKLPSTDLEHSSELHDSVIPKEIEEKRIIREDKGLDTASPQLKKGGDDNKVPEEITDKNMQENIKLTSNVLEHSSPHSKEVVVGSEALTEETNQNERSQEDSQLPSNVFEHTTEPNEIEEERIVQDGISLVTASPQLKKELDDNNVPEEKTDETMENNKLTSNVLELRDSVIPKEIVEEQIAQDDKSLITMSPQLKEENCSEMLKEETDEVSQSLQGDNKLLSKLEHSSEHHDSIIPKEIEEKIVQNDKLLTKGCPQPKEEETGSVVLKEETGEHLHKNHELPLTILDNNDAVASTEINIEQIVQGDKGLKTAEPEEEIKQIDEPLQEHNNLPSITLKHSSEFHDTVIPKETEEDRIEHDDKTLTTMSLQLKKKENESPLQEEGTKETGERLQNNELPSTVLEHSSELHDSVLPKEIEEKKIIEDDTSLPTMSPKVKKDEDDSVSSEEPNEISKPAKDDNQLPLTTLEHSRELHDSVVSKQINDETLITTSPQLTEEEDDNVKLEKTDKTRKSLEDDKNLSSTVLKHSSDLHDSVVPREEELIAQDGNNLTTTSSQLKEDTDNSVVPEGIEKKQIVQDDNNLKTASSKLQKDKVGSVTPKETDQANKKLQEDNLPSTVLQHSSQLHDSVEPKQIVEEPVVHEHKSLITVSPELSEQRDDMVALEETKQTKKDLQEDNTLPTTDNAELEKTGENLKKDNITSTTEPNTELHDSMISNKNKNELLNDDKTPTNSQLNDEKPSNISLKAIAQTDKKSQEDLPSTAIQKSVLEDNKSTEVTTSLQLEEEPLDLATKESDEAKGQLEDKGLLATGLQHSSEFHDMIPKEMDGAEEVLENEKNATMTSSPLKEELLDIVTSGETNKSNKNSKDNQSISSTALQHSSEFHDATIPKEVAEEKQILEDKNMTMANLQVSEERISKETVKIDRDLQENKNLLSTALQHSSEHHDMVIPNKIVEKPILKEDESITMMSPQLENESPKKEKDKHMAKTSSSVDDVAVAKETDGDNTSLQDDKLLPLAVAPQSISDLSDATTADEVKAVRQESKGEISLTTTSPHLNEKASNFEELKKDDKDSEEKEDTNLPLAALQHSSELHDPVVLKEALVQEKNRASEIQDNKDLTTAIVLQNGKSGNKPLQIEISELHGVDEQQKLPSENDNNVTVTNSAINEEQQVQEEIDKTHKTSKAEASPVATEDKDATRTKSIIENFPSKEDEQLTSSSPRDKALDDALKLDKNNLQEDKDLAATDSEHVTSTKTDDNIIESTTPTLQHSGELHDLIISKQLTKQNSDKESDKEMVNEKFEELHQDMVTASPQLSNVTVQKSTEAKENLVIDTLQHDFLTPKEIDQTTENGDLVSAKKTKDPLILKEFDSATQDNNNLPDSKQDTEKQDLDMCNEIDSNNQEAKDDDTFQTPNVNLPSTLNEINQEQKSSVVNVPDLNESAGLQHSGELHDLVLASNENENKVNDDKNMVNASEEPKSELGEADRHSENNNPNVEDVTTTSLLHSGEFHDLLIPQEGEETKQENVEIVGVAATPSTTEILNDAHSVDLHKDDPEQVVEQPLMLPVDANVDKDLVSENSGELHHAVSSQHIGEDSKKDVEEVDGSKPVAPNQVQKVEVGKDKSIGNENTLYQHFSSSVLDEPLESGAPPPSTDKNSAYEALSVDVQRDDNLHDNIETTKDHLSNDANTKSSSPPQILNSKDKESSSKVAPQSLELIQSRAITPKQLQIIELPPKTTVNDTATFKQPDDQEPLSKPTSSYQVAPVNYSRAKGDHDRHDAEEKLLEKVLQKIPTESEKEKRSEDIFLETNDSSNSEENKVKVKNANETDINDAHSIEPARNEATKVIKEVKEKIEMTNNPSTDVLQNENNHNLDCKTEQEKKQPEKTISDKDSPTKESDNENGNVKENQNQQEAMEEHIKNLAAATLVSHSTKTNEEDVNVLKDADITEDKVPGSSQVVSNKMVVEEEKSAEIGLENPKTNNILDEAKEVVNKQAATIELEHVNRNEHQSADSDIVSKNSNSNEHTAESTNTVQDDKNQLKKDVTKSGTFDISKLRTELGDAGKLVEENKNYEIENALKDFKETTGDDLNKVDALHSIAEIHDPSSVEASSTISNIDNFDNNTDQKNYEHQKASVKESNELPAFDIFTLRAELADVEKQIEKDEEATTTIDNDEHQKCEVTTPNTFDIGKLRSELENVGREEDGDENETIKDVTAAKLVETKEQEPDIVEPKQQNHVQITEKDNVDTLKDNNLSSPPQSAGSKLKNAVRNESEDQDYESAPAKAHDPSSVQSSNTNNNIDSVDQKTNEHQERTVKDSNEASAFDISTLRSELADIEKEIEKDDEEALSNANEQNEKYVLTTPSTFDIGKLRSELENAGREEDEDKNEKIEDNAAEKVVETAEQKPNVVKPEQQDHGKVIPKENVGTLCADLADIEKEKVEEETTTTANRQNEKYEVTTSNTFDIGKLRSELEIAGKEKDEDKNDKIEGNAVAKIAETEKPEPKQQSHDKILPKENVGTLKTHNLSSPPHSADSTSKSALTNESEGSPSAKTYDSSSIEVSKTNNSTDSVDNIVDQKTNEHPEATIKDGNKASAFDISTLRAELADIEKEVKKDDKETTAIANEQNELKTAGKEGDEDNYQKVEDNTAEKVVEKEEQNSKQGKIIQKKNVGRLESDNLSSPPQSAEMKSKNASTHESQASEYESAPTRPVTSDITSSIILNENIQIPSDNVYKHDQATDLDQHDFREIITPDTESFKGEGKNEKGDLGAEKIKQEDDKKSITEDKIAKTENNSKEIKEDSSILSKSDHLSINLSRLDEENQINQEQENEKDGNKIKAEDENERPVSITSTTSTDSAGTVIFNGNSPLELDDQLKDNVQMQSLGESKKLGEDASVTSNFSGKGEQKEEANTDEDDANNDDKKNRIAVIPNTADLADNPKNGLLPATNSKKVEGIEEPANSSAEALSVSAALIAENKKITTELKETNISDKIQKENPDKKEDSQFTLASVEKHNNTIEIINTPEIIADQEKTKPETGDKDVTKDYSENSVADNLQKDKINDIHNKIVPNEEDKNEVVQNNNDAATDPVASDPKEISSHKGNSDDEIKASNKLEADVEETPEENLKQVDKILPETSTPNEAKNATVTNDKNNLEETNTLENMSRPHSTKSNEAVEDPEGAIPILLTNSGIDVRENIYKPKEDNITEKLQKDSNQKSDEIHANVVNVGEDGKTKKQNNTNFPNGKVTHDSEDCNFPKEISDFKTTPAEPVETSTIKKDKHTTNDVLTKNANLDEQEKEDARNSEESKIQEKPDNVPASEPVGVKEESNSGSINKNKTNDAVHTDTKTENPKKDQQDVTLEKATPNLEIAEEMADLQLGQQESVHDKVLNENKLDNVVTLLQDQDSSPNNQHAAATKIQSGYRGYRVRRSLNVNHPILPKKRDEEITQSISNSVEVDNHIKDTLLRHIDDEDDSEAVPSENTKHKEVPLPCITESSDFKTEDNKDADISENIKTPEMHSPKKSNNTENPDDTASPAVIVFNNQVKHSDKHGENLIAEPNLTPESASRALQEVKDDKVFEKSVKPEETRQNFSKSKEESTDHLDEEDNFFAVNPFKHASAPPLSLLDHEEDSDLGIQFESEPKELSNATHTEKEQETNDKTVNFGKLPEHELLKISTSPINEIKLEEEKHLKSENKDRSSKSPEAAEDKANKKTTTGKIIEVASAPTHLLISNLSKALDTEPKVVDDADASKILKKHEDVPQTKDSTEPGVSPRFHKNEDRPVTQALEIVLDQQLALTAPGAVKKEESVKSEGPEYIYIPLKDPETALISESISEGLQHSGEYHDTVVLPSAIGSPKKDAKLHLATSVTENDKQKQEIQNAHTASDRAPQDAKQEDGSAPISESLSEGLQHSGEYHDTVVPLVNYSLKKDTKLKLATSVAENDKQKQGIQIAHTASDHLPQDAKEEEKNVSKYDLLEGGVSPRASIKREGTVTKALGVVLDQQLAITTPKAKVKEGKKDSKAEEPQYMYIPLKDPNRPAASVEEDSPNHNENVTQSLSDKSIRVSDQHLETAAHVESTNRDSLSNLNNKAPSVRISSTDGIKGNESQVSPVHPSKVLQEKEVFEKVDKINETKLEFVPRSSVSPTQSNELHGATTFVISPNLSSTSGSPMVISANAQQRPESAGMRDSTSPGTASFGLQLSFSPSPTHHVEEIAGGISPIPEGKESSLDSPNLGDDRSAQSESPLVIQTTQIPDNALPLAVQLNQSPAGAAVLTSPTPDDAEASICTSGSQQTAHAPGKAASTKDAAAKNSAHFRTSMETGNRKNAAILEKNMEDLAATKIQASFRGYQVRKQLKCKNGGVESVRRSLRRKSSGKLRGSDKSQKSSGKDSDLEEKSATKIQAGVRGFLVRRRQKKNAKTTTPDSP